MATNSITDKMTIVSTETRLITPAEAQTLSEMFYEDVQRNIRKGLVASFLSTMRSNRWSMSEGMLIVGSHGERKVLIAGNHRMLALAQFDRPLTFTIQEREYPSDEAMRLDYILSTNGGRKATVTDKVRAMESSEKLGISREWTVAAVSALRAISVGLSASNVGIATDEECLMALPQWETAIRAYVKASHGCHGKEYTMAQRAIVMAVGLLTFRYQPALALGFWEKLWNNDGLRKGEPEWALRYFLTTVPAVTLGSRSRTYATAISMAWNARAENRPLFQVKQSDSFVFRVSGTPINDSFNDWRGLVVGGK